MSAFKDCSVVKLDFSDQINPGFPLIVDDTTLAFHLNIRTKTLWYLLHKRNQKKAYKCFAIPQFQEDGTLKKMREIQEPMPHLKTIHSILNRMFSSVQVDPAISAYVRRKNCADAAKKHVRKSFTFGEGTPVEEDEQKLIDDPRYTLKETVEHSHDPESKKIRVYHQPICMIKMDIQNFFPSIKASWIRAYFTEEVGYSHYVAGLIATLCSVKRDIKSPGKDTLEVRHLPQGSPLSGSLANLVGFHRFGKQIKEMLKQHSADWVFTIYSDDIVITHPSNTLSDEEAFAIRDKMSDLITASGFKVNVKKTLVKRSNKEKIKILGCIVTDKLNVPKQVRNRLANRIYNCKTKGFESQCDKNQTVEGLVMYLRGMIEYVKSIRPDLAKEYTEKLKEAIEANDFDFNPTTLEGTLF